MNMTRQVNRMFMLACAPFLGMLLWMFTANFSISLPELQPLPAFRFSLATETENLSNKLALTNTNGVAIKSTIEKFYQLYEKSANDVSTMVKTAAAQATRPNAIFDSRLSTVYGKPVRTASSSNIDLKLYAFSDTNYKGYALKADLKSDKAMKMVLGKDQIGSSETTLAAASRYGAVAGVNAGGFADDNSGKRYPTGNTIVNGKYAYGFYPNGLFANTDHVTFVGLNADRKLIGGKFKRQEELDKLKPTFGATFVPILMQNGKKQDIPYPWQSSPYRAPRTIIGNFKNDQLFVIVTDGYDERGGSGATLAELQDRLQQLGIKDAYNLDGGGSSTLIFDGQIINKPSDGRMRSLPTHFLFFK